MFHAGGLFAFLTPLFYVGGRIVLSRTFDLDDTLQAIVEEKLHRRPRRADDLPDVDERPCFARSRLQPRALLHQRRGAPATSRWSNDWLDAKGGVFRQGYGLTEVGANCFSMTDEESVPKTGSVGKPIFHSQMRLVDPKPGRMCPSARPGELLIAGPHVCTGYWRNPEATAESLRGGLVLHRRHGPHG